MRGRATHAITALPQPTKVVFQEIKTRPPTSATERKKNRKRKCVSILHIAEHSITNFNGDGGEHSHTEKRRVEGHRTVKIPKKRYTKIVSLMSQKNKRG